MNKNDFGKKLKKKKKKRKTRHLQIQKKLNSLLIKDYNFLLGRMYFTDDGDFQNMFIDQSINSKLEIQKSTFGIECILNGPQRI